MRDNILETLEEGILAFDTNGIIQFVNESALRMLCDNPWKNPVGQNVDIIGDEILSRI